MDKLENFEIERKKYLKKVRLFMWIAIGSFIAFFILFFCGIIITIEDSPSLLVLFFCGILFLVSTFFAVLSTIYSKKWKIYFKNNIVKVLIEKEYPNCEFSESNGFSFEEFYEPKFFAKTDRYLSSNYMKAVYKDILIRASDFELQRRQQNEKGSSYYVTVAKGRMYILTFDRVFENIVKVTEKTGLLNFNFTSMKKVEMESVEFNKKFLTLSTDDLAAFYVLTPQIQETMLNIEKQFKGTIYYCFKDNHLFIAINNGEESFKCSVFTPLNNLDKVLNEIRIPQKLVDAFKLDREKFNSNSTTSGV